MDLPTNVLSKAIRAVPAVKYAIGVTGLIASIAIVASMHISYSLAALGTVVMLVLMTSLLVFARITTASQAIMHVPALVFTWFALLLTMGTALLLFTSVFFGTPVDLQTVFASPKTKTEVDTRAVPHIVSANQGEGRPFATMAMGLTLQHLPPPKEILNSALIEMSLGEFQPLVRVSEESLPSLNGPTGLKVLGVIKTGPAYQAGIRRGDIISRIEHVPIWNQKQWATFTKMLQQNSKVQLEIWREGKPVDTFVTPVDLVKLDQDGCLAKDENACFGLGLLNERGNIIEKNLQRAQFYLRSACTLKFGGACSELGVLYNDRSLLWEGCLLRDAIGCREYGLRATASDPKGAIRNLRAACDYGDPVGCLQLASSRGAALAPTEAQELYRRACWWGEEKGCQLLDPTAFQVVIAEVTKRQMIFQMRQPMYAPERIRDEMLWPGEEREPHHVEIP
jgi:hypothetical protein